MAATASDLAAVESALFRGELTVAFADRSVTYRSMQELREIRNIIRAELYPRAKQTYCVTSKGWD